MVTFSVVVNLLFFSSVAIVLLKYIFKDNKVILQLDTRFLMICMLVILCRMLIPVESPLTNNIAVSMVYPEVCRFLRKPIINHSTFGDISIMAVFQFVWFIGAFVPLFRLIKAYVEIKKEIAASVEIKDSHVVGLVEKVNRQYRHPVKFRLYNMENGSTPCVFGILHPCILIPDILVTEKELEFILSHEMRHYYRGDLLLKLFCEIFKAIYWWNPFAYMLCKLIAQTQEINVDFSIMRKQTDAETLDYSACLLKLKRDSESRKADEKWLLSFQRESSGLLEKRICLMLDNLGISTQKTIVSIILSVVMVGLIIVCPNVVTFEPYSIPEGDAKESLGLREEGNYYLENEYGTYDLYVDGNYVMTSDVILVEHIPVYLQFKEESVDD